MKSRHCWDVCIVPSRCRASLAAAPRRYHAPRRGQDRSRRYFLPSLELLPPCAGCTGCGIQPCWDELASAHQEKKGRRAGTCPTPTPITGAPVNSPPRPSTLTSNTAPRGLTCSVCLLLLSFATMLVAQNRNVEHRCQQPRTLSKNRWTSWRCRGNSLWDWSPLKSDTARRR